MTLFDALDVRLKVQGFPLGGGFGPETVEIPLLDAEISILADTDDDGNEFRRVIEISTDEWYVMFEADHRGPEHGVDAWFKPTDPEQDEEDRPCYVVTDVWQVDTDD